MGHGEKKDGGIPEVFVKRGDQTLALSPIQSTRQQAGEEREREIEKK
jgi:hypothetical protein